MEEPVEDTQAVLAAYRERKRQALQAREASESHSIDEEGAALPPATHHPVQAAPTPTAADPPTPPAPPPAAPPAPAPGPGVAPDPWAGPSALAVQPSGGLSSSPGATLSALGPVFRLSDALLKDARVSVRGSPRLRAAGIALLLVGLGLFALDRRQLAAGAPVAGLGFAAVLAVGIGIVLAVAGLFLPRSRRLAVRLAASQHEEWKRIQAETQRLQLLTRVGLLLSIVGLLGLAAAYAVASFGLLVAAAGLTLVGLPLLVTAQVRRSLARRLYVQTLVLSGLEATGLGAVPDERVRPVILALDRLLGALPEAEVQAFLATPQARAYLELVDEATRVQRGP